MDFKDKLFQQRKAFGLTQSELAEKLNVSRQAISKWEMGTAIPDVSNVLALSKVFNVTVDFLVNSEVEYENEKDSPHIKATIGICKMKYHSIILKIIIILSIATLAIVNSITTHSYFSTVLLLLIIGFIFLFFHILRLVMLFLSNKNFHNNKNKKEDKIE